MPRTSVTHPIRVDRLSVKSVQLGLTFCPGKHGDSLTGAPWARDLDTDLTALKSQETNFIVTLVEPFELDLLKVPNLGEQVAVHGMDWLHLPIRDQEVPTNAFEDTWPTACADILARLEAGENVVLHCRGGLGRAGLVAAIILLETGLQPDEAMRAIRGIRPRAIETIPQEEYVLAYEPKL